MKQLIQLLVLKHGLQLLFLFLIEHAFPDAVLVHAVIQQVVYGTPGVNKQTNTNKRSKSSPEHMDRMRSPSTKKGAIMRSSGVNQRREMYHVKKPALIVVGC